MLCSHLQGEHPKKLHKTTTKQPRIPASRRDRIRAVTPAKEKPTSNN